MSWEKLIKDNKPLVVTGTINAYSALLAERAGIKAIYLSGGGVANASYGLPDLAMTSREDVLELKGQKIFSNKKFFPKTKDNEFYINDLIECMIFLKDNTSIGKVLSVQNFGAGDLLEVKYNTKLTLIPFDKTNILSVNINKKEIIADPIPGILD